MQHILKSSAMASRHVLKPKHYESSATQTHTLHATVATQTDESFLNACLDSTETGRLATEALKAANETQRNLSRFMREAITRLNFYSVEESRYFADMASQMDSFADDFDQLTGSAEAQKDDLESFNQQLSELNDRYAQDFPASALQHPPGPGSKPEAHVSNRQPIHKQVELAISRERRAITPPPVHGRLESASFFAPPNKKRKRVKKDKNQKRSKELQEPSTDTNAATQDTSLTCFMTRPSEPLKIVLRREKRE